MSLRRRKSSAYVSRGKPAFIWTSAGSLSWERGSTCCCCRSRRSWGDRPSRVRLLCRGPLQSSYPWETDTWAGVVIAFVVKFLAFLYKNAGVTDDGLHEHMFVIRTILMIEVYWLWKHQEVIIMSNKGELWYFSACTNICFTQNLYSYWFVHGCFIVVVTRCFNV